MADFIVTLPGAVRLQAVQGVGRAFRWGLIRVSEESGNREGIQKVSQDRRACTATLVIKAYWEIFLNHTSGPMEAIPSPWAGAWDLCLKSSLACENYCDRDPVLKKVVTEASVIMVR